MDGKGPKARRQMGRGIPEEANLNPGTEEIARAVMPDFSRWRRFFFQLDCLGVGLTFVIGCTFFVYFTKMGLIEEVKLNFLFFHLILPTLLNVAILTGAAVLKKRLPEEDLRQNVIPIFALLMIDFVICMSHRVFLITAAIFCIPICMTTVFSNKTICKLVTNISLLGMILTTIKQLLTTPEPDEHMLILPQALILFCILVTMGIVAQTALSMTEGQKKKLINYASSIKTEQRRAEAASIAKSTFLANMSHEIRTPINAILGMNEMVLRENKDPQIEEYAESIQSAGNSLLYLVNDVLDISKIESGKLEIEAITYETSSFIHDCCTMIAERAQKKGLELKIECDPNLPSTLRGDEVRLRQVVTNLLSNAAKYTQKGSITLSVDSRMEGEQFQLIVQVKDTGIGIKEDNIASLFSQFTRFDMQKNRNIEGTGLGLAISKQLLDLMHGDIEVQSIYGVGSSFTVTVPQEIVDNTPMGDFHANYRDIGRENAEYRQSFEAPNAKILVVDDVEVNLKVIVNLLKKTKINVEVAHSGRQCISMITQNTYDLIFLDHMMPEMDGIETYDKMRKLDNSLNKETPVIMLTANAISGVREKYLELGFADYLSKPVSSEKLEKMLLKYLPERKIQTEASESAQEPQKELSEEPQESFGGVLGKLKSAYPGVDLKLGLKTCADSEDVYIDILKTFGEDVKTEEFKTLYEEKKLDDYRILVHGIKSASLSVGFVHLSEMAKALEGAVKEGDTGYVEDHHPAFLEEYQKVLDVIGQALAEG